MVIQFSNGRQVPGIPSLSLEDLMVEHDPPKVIKHKNNNGREVTEEIRWEWVPRGSYRVLKVEPYEIEHIKRLGIGMPIAL